MTEIMNRHAIQTKTRCHAARSIRHLMAMVFLSGMALMATVELTLSPVGNAVFAGSAQSRSVTARGIDPRIRVCRLSWSARTVPGRRTLRAGELDLQPQKGMISVALTFPVPPTRPGVVVPLQLDVTVTRLMGSAVTSSWELLAVHPAPGKEIGHDNLTIYVPSDHSRVAENLRQAGVTVHSAHQLEDLIDRRPELLVVQPQSGPSSEGFGGALWELVDRGWGVLVIQPPSGYMSLPPDAGDVLAVIRLVDHRIVHELEPAFSTDFDIAPIGMRLCPHRNRLSVQTGTDAGRGVWTEFIHAESGGILVLFTLPRMEPMQWEKDARARYLLVAAMRHIIKHADIKGKDT